MAILIMRYLIVIALFVLSGAAFSQERNSLIADLQQQSEGEGLITIHDEEGIEELVNIQVEVNRRMGGVDGYRIQLYSGSGPSGKKEALSAKRKFLNNFPAYDTDLSFTSPFWRVRVGNYRHKHEALLLLNDLRQFFPNCYIVKDGNVNMNKF